MSTDHQIAEYTALKLEQSNRILLREAALHVNILLTITAIGTLSGGTNSDLLPTLIPVVNLIIYWIYHNNDFYINKLRGHVKELSKTIDDDGRTVFGWEDTYKDSGLGRFVRKLAAFTAVFAAFFLPAGYYLWLSKPQNCQLTIENATWFVIVLFLIIAVIGMLLQSSLFRDRWTDQ